MNLSKRYDLKLMIGVAVGGFKWIEYDKFENVEYLAKGGFGTVYRAIWKAGHMHYWDSKNNQWERNKNIPVVLKCLHNSQDISIEFLKEVRYLLLVF